MVWLWIALGAALLLLLGGFVCMLAAMRRFRFVNPLDPRVLGASSWKRYMEPVLQGADWIKAHTAGTVSIESFDGLRLCARFCPAENARGTLIMMHGFRSEGCVDFGATAQYCHELGYNLLLADQRAHGRSEGRYITYGILERDDCRRWCEYCAERFGPEHPLFLSGISMGAATVLMASSLPLPASVRGIVADCGFTSAWDILRHVMKHRYHVPVVPFLALADLFARLFVRTSLRGPGAVDAVAQTKLPILLIHGTGDRFVPCEMTRRNYAACQSEKYLLLVEGAGHGVSFLTDPDACKAALRTFLYEH